MIKIQIKQIYYHNSTTMSHEDCSRISLSGFRVVSIDTELERPHQSHHFINSQNKPLIPLTAPYTVCTLYTNSMYMSLLRQTM